jgi:hypothetical protein
LAPPFFLAKVSNMHYRIIKKYSFTGCQWLMHAILATWEAEIGRIAVQGQPKQIVRKTPISKITTAKWTGSVIQAVEHLLCKARSPEFKLQSHQKKKKKV